MKTKTQIKKRTRFSAAVLCCITIVLTIILSACNGGNNDAANAGNDTQGSKDTKESQVINQGESLVINLSDISADAKFYPVTVDGKRMELVAVKAPDGTVRTAFNTCQVCMGSPKAYFEQAGTALECQNCKNQFAFSRVGIESGGCNPVPILDNEKTVTDTAITVSYDTLKANTSIFSSNWKS